MAKLEPGSNQPDAVKPTLKKLSGWILGQVCKGIVGNQPTVSLAQEIMKYTTVKISEILKHPTLRLDPKYWIKKKKKLKKLQASSSKLQA